MKRWLFKLLFRAEYEHMRHLIGDVIELEQRNGLLRSKVEAGSNSETVYEEATGG